MITREKFDSIKKKYSRVASWAIWAHEDEEPKSNMGDLTVLDPEINKNLLSELNPNVVLVALNFSEDVNHKPFENFHAGGKFQDYKTRYALRDSPYWGGYMTDIIKNHPEKKSGELVKYLKTHPDEVQSNVESFRQELRDIGAEKPTLIAFGIPAHTILKRNLSEFEIRKITHYAHRINKEKYREEVKQSVS
ncbi:uncharacterized protein METZ01_LOCUS398490 [marine metagenome]|uniref:Uncharacterized protein n=1 Tax=marine metagenome TaxID=408172 RepID=A0A382VGH5_9ZZZZ